jgi:hypothetical protein
MNEKDPLAANAGDPHQHDDNERDEACRVGHELWPERWYSCQDPACPHLAINPRAMVGCNCFCCLSAYLVAVGVGQAGRPLQPHMPKQLLICGPSTTRAAMITMRMRARIKA